MNIYYIIIIIIILYILYKIYYQQEHFNDNNIIYNFISNDECDELINMCNNRFIDSTIYETTTGNVNKSARSSKNVYFQRSENKLISIIEDKVSEIFKLDKNQLEPLQIVKYDKGNEYKLHYDYFNEKSDQISNQRVYSILIYLNDLKVEDGGSTYFPLYNIRIRPEKGKAIYWLNKKDDRLNTMSLHAGEPVLTDTVKYVLTVWTREIIYS